MSSRWADTAEDAAEDARRKAEKEERKRLKAQKQRKNAEQETAPAVSQIHHGSARDEDEESVAKRRRLSHETERHNGEEIPTHLLRFAPRPWQPSRSVERYTRLNHIEEGSYGYVSRAREEATGEIVAIKKLKLDPQADGGFPVTALREIQCLRVAQHIHVVKLREVVVGEGDAQGDVYLVMNFAEHDLKTLQEDMDEPFMPSEIKTILGQLGEAITFLHSHWILHRDLKTSNILLDNTGRIKVADFGMARFCGDPPAENLTQLVVTLWYRAPELLLGTKVYGTAVDMWSIGCIFGELVKKEPILPGKNEVDELSKIFELCGIPTDESWPSFKRLPNARTLRLPTSNKNAQGSIIRSRFSTLTNHGVALLDSLLSLDPAKRISMKEMQIHPYFRELPRMKAPSLFPTFPSKAGQEKRRRYISPNAPIRGAAPSLTDLDYSSIFKGREGETSGGGFQLKLV